MCVCVCVSRSDVKPKSCETGFGVSRVVKRVKNTVFTTFSKKTPIFLQSFLQSFLNLQSFLEIAIFSEKSASFRRNLDQRVVKKSQSRQLVTISGFGRFFTPDKHYFNLKNSNTQIMEVFRDWLLKEM